MPYLRVNPVAVSEGAATVSVTVLLDAPSSNEIKVSYDTNNGLANYSTSQPDFQRLFGTLTFAPGETSKTLTINIVNNTVAESTELFWIDLYNPVNATVGQRYWPVLIRDNDGTAGAPQIAVSDRVVDEAHGLATFFVSLNRPSTATVTVQYATADDSATAGADFTATSGTLSFAPGETVKTVTVPIVNDGAAEADEFFGLLLSNPGNATLVDAAGLAQIGANDANPVGAPAVSARPIAADESQVATAFVVQLSAPSTNEVRVSYDLNNGTANYSTSVPDFQRVYDTLVFAPGETTKVVTVPIVDNSAVEPAEVFWLDLYNPVNATVPQRYTPGLLHDNDATAGTPALAVSDAVVDERAGTLSFFVRLDRPSTGTVTVNYASADGTAQAGSDYRAAAGTLSFAAGEVVKTVTVDIVDDGEAEADEVFTLELGGPSGATLVDGSGRALIGRSDANPVGAPHVTATAVAADESQPLAGFIVQLSAPSTNEVKVSYDLNNGTANYSTSVPDFQRIYDTLVFAPGETTRFVPLAVIDNTTAEATELYWLELYNPVNATVPQRYVPSLLFDNDDVAGVPAIAVGDVTVDEGAGTASFQVWLDRPSTARVGVAWATADDSATAGADYRAASGTLSFAPGEIVKTVTIDVFDDATPEVDEFFRLQLSDPVNAGIVDPGGVARIGRSDGAPSGMPYITAQPAYGDESQPAMSFVVQLSAPSGNEVSVAYDLANASANYSTSAPDFHRHYGTLVFAPGETTRVISVPIVDSTAAEGVEAFWLELYSPVNAVVPQRLVPGRLVDNDAVAGTPAISIGDAVVDERAGTASLQVWLNKPATGNVSVAYTTADDLAAAGSDYRAAAGTLVFAPGETVKTLVVDIVDDGLAEFDERFAVRLGNPVNGSLADGVGAVLIGRSDTALRSQPQISATPLVVGEGEVLAGFVVRLSAPSGNVVRVNFDLANGSANYSTSAPDFQRHFGTLEFAPGQTTLWLPLALFDDTLAEGDETWSLNLSAPVNATISQTQTGGLIVDNDGPASYAYGLGNDSYSVSSAQDRIAESPHGGIDTVRSSVSYTLPENVENLVLTGSAASGIGNASNNVFRGTAGNNTFEGGAGIDTAVFGGPRAAYTIAGSGAQRSVSGGGDGSDTLSNVERLQFSDMVLAGDTAPGQHTYLAYAMLNAAFDAAPDTALLSQWTAQLDRLGGNLEDLAQAMINFYAPGVPNDALVAHLWGTIVESPIPADALALYTGLVNDGQFTQASLVAMVTTLELNTVEIAGIVGQTLTLDPAWFAVPG